jgi:methionyl-tRNA synthetase
VELAKDPANRDELASVLYAAAETLRVLAVAVAPIMPRALYACGRSGSRPLAQRLGRGGRARRG